MLFKILQKLELNENSLLISLFTISFLIRVPVIYFFGDTTVTNEWGQLLYYLVNHNILSLREVPIGEPLPNLLMPPLYAYYLYIFSLLELKTNNYIFLVLLSQVILASISVVVFFKINRFFFTKRISFISSIVFSLFPIYLYASGKISSVSLTIFLALLFYYYFLEVKEKSTYINIFIFSIIGGLLILIRREFILIFLFTNIYLFFVYKITFKKFFIIFLISIFTISPYLVRNFLIFDKIIMSSGMGYNLWKANNPNAKVDGSDIIDNNLRKILNNLEEDKFYRINEDKVFYEEAIKNIKSDPLKYLILYFKRNFSFFFIDFESTNSIYYNPFHYIPILILGIFSFFGLILSDKKSSSLNYFILVIFLYIAIFSFFALQARYRIYIIPIQIIFSNVAIKFIVNKHFKKIT